MYNQSQSHLIYEIIKNRLWHPKKHDEQARQTKVSQGKRKKRIADDHPAGVEASAISSAATGHDEIRTGGAIARREIQGNLSELAEERFLGESFAN
jgi:hypothetical protein